MKPRDLIVVVAVVLIAGFAAADALRGRAARNESPPPATVPVQTAPTRLPGPQPQSDAPAGWPVGTLSGSLVFTDSRDCRVRVIGLSGGVERPLSRFAGNCQLWAPPATDRIAYGLGPASGDGFSPFKLADLAHPNAELGGYRALFGVVIWSLDGQRVAWCGRRRVGFDLEVGGGARRLRSCPVAYTEDDRIAYAIGDDLVVGDRIFLHARGGITFATFLADGSVVIELGGKRIEVYGAGGRRRFGFDLPPELEGRTPIVSPDGCASMFRTEQEPVGGIQLVNLGCFKGIAPRFFQGRDATWSPDGHWIGVAEPDAILFREVVGGNSVASWPAPAAQLAWRPR